MPDCVLRQPKIDPILMLFLRFRLHSIIVSRLHFRASSYLQASSTNLSFIVLGICLHGQLKSWAHMPPSFGMKIVRTFATVTIIPSPRIISGPSSMQRCQHFERCQHFVSFSPAQSQAVHNLQHQQCIILSSILFFPGLKFPPTGFTMT